MMNMKSKNRRWLFAWAIASSLLQILQCEPVEVNNVVNSTKHDDSIGTKEVRSIFSPQMDYEQWTPVGRADPFNDPTYDYVPPVLERVHYWVDPAQRKPDPPLPGENQKTEILVLGVSSNKPSSPSINAESRRDTYDPFVKFVDGPKFQSTYQRISRPHFQMPSYPFFNSPYHKAKGSSERVVYKTEQRVPYTILMPPPIPSSKPITESFTTPSSTSYTIQEANLIYQSSTTSQQQQQHEWKDDKNFYTVADSSSVVTWRTPLPYEFNDQAEKVKNTTEEIQISGPDLMFKGQVSNGDMDVSSTYVNIGKPEAQVHSISGTSAMNVDPPVLTQMKNPITLQSLQTMQTMQPPSMATIKSNSLATLLEKEITPAMMSTYMANIPKATTKAYTTTTTPIPSTTSIHSLTTDPLFRHYKQPSEPLRGPMYLIIQGHSKVKTYGPSKQMHGIKIHESNEIPINDYKDALQVKHLHSYKKKPEETARIGRAKNFDTLSQAVRTGFGAIEYANRDIQETELTAGFDVEAAPASSEIYHKGIVEEAKLKEA
ncbi:PREDICTED: uncharacterized protein LOC108561955 isoform X2 [Nicrophorus vespilloides]|uniref:Uncharacterized protein LOC108561955 isoform X2 n=1 Tax=Nicrophorus vespilloides TaxID=110193 RepID=A0ABM1MM10_NICVS|nr:PREDICTED: uncharacterized protein LOC108561955 isoform X2 [Nicrophorus vespilloides]